MGKFTDRRTLLYSKLIASYGQQRPVIEPESVHPALPFTLRAARDDRQGLQERDSLSDRLSDHVDHEDSIENPVQVRLFHDALLRGTRATIRLVTAVPDDEQSRTLSQRDNSEASCWVWREKERLQVRCYNNGQPIRFCGHGLLASAHAWQQAHRARRMPLELDSRGVSYRLSTEDRLWLYCPRIACRPTASFPLHWFDLPPETAARAGGDHGYWILRWPAGFDLARLQPRLTMIARESHGGVIVTAASTTPDCDATLRYFAPAYGNPEDSVTGSAAVVLADYWQCPELRLQQRSPQGGGRMEVRLGGSVVALGGSVEEIPV